MDDETAEIELVRSRCYTAHAMHVDRPKQLPAPAESEQNTANIEANDEYESGDVRKCMALT